MHKKRCGWVNYKNPLYVKYHDEQWGKPLHDDQLLFELLILECFQAGLSWECILNKRNHFKQAFDNFNIDKIILYDSNKINNLLLNKNIIRNKLKIYATINNAVVFKKIQNEFESFDKYIWNFTDNKIICESFEINTKNALSDKISKDLKNRGMKFIGSTIIYSYLQAIGIINGHSENCFLYKNFN